MLGPLPPLIIAVAIGCLTILSALAMPLVAFPQNMTPGGGVWEAQHVYPVARMFSIALLILGSMSTVYLAIIRGRWYFLILALLFGVLIPYKWFLLLSVLM